MYIITVIPIKRGLEKEYLTYFYPTYIEIGNIVVAPMKSRKIDALVVDVTPLVSIKSEIKNTMAFFF
jgi:hypothetical protein